MADKRKRVDWNGRVFELTREAVLKHWPDAPEEVLRQVDAVRTRSDVLRLMYPFDADEALLKILGLEKDDDVRMKEAAHRAGAFKKSRKPRAPTGFWETNPKKTQAVLKMFDEVNEKVEKGEIKTAEELNEERDKIIAFVNDGLPAEKHLDWHAIQLFANRTKNNRHFPHPNELKKSNTAEDDSKPILVLEERTWDHPEVLSVNEEAWEKPGVRVGGISRIDYFSDGFRAGLVRVEFEICAFEGTHYNVLDGGLISKKAHARKIQERISNERKASRGVSGEDKELIIANVNEEAAKALAALIPKILKPGTDSEFVRLYITTSPTYDGPHGETIALRLQELRDDIRVEEPGGVKLDVKPDKTLWVLNPRRNRLPSKYYSTAAEKEINEKRAQTSREYPTSWMVGCHASAVHKPGRGERHEPYVTLPAGHRLEEITQAENQIGVVINEYLPGRKAPRVRVWNLKDLAAREREFITGIKTGAGDIHRRIVDCIKKRGARTVGLICDHLGAQDRSDVENALEFLCEERASARKTWPGLKYNPAPQSYDFHLDWVQERLRLPFPSGPFVEDSFLFFGCLHAGYTTTDYRYVVDEFPKIIVENDVTILCGLGDFIAGLYHDFLCTGEVFGSLNTTDQEKLAAECVGTVIYKAFVERFNRDSATKDIREFSDSEFASFVADRLVDFYFIPGNHDLWQERDGTQALVTFELHLLNLLSAYIQRFCLEKGRLIIGVSDILSGKIHSFYDFQARCELSSGLTLEMFHPHMARAKTTSLRAQETMQATSANVVGIANFHTATVVHEWWSDRGQCVAAQVGAQLIWTRFERRKTKIVDFGPVLLRIRSKDGRVMVSESEFFNEPFLKEPISKSTDVSELRRKLGILTI